MSNIFIIREYREGYVTVYNKGFKSLEKAEDYLLEEFDAIPVKDRKGNFTGEYMDCVPNPYHLDKEPIYTILSIDITD